MNNEIKIGLGLGKVTFGSSKESIKKNLGEPNEIEVLDIPIDGEEVSLEQWHYDELELSASFDLEQEETLDTLAVSSDEYTINGISLIGKSIFEINQLLNTLHLGSFEKEKITDEDGNSTVYSFVDSNMNFWFEEDELTEIQWGPIYLDEDPPIFAN